MARKLVGDDYAEERSRERKGDIAAAMERTVAESTAETEGFDAAMAIKTARWLPDGMAFQGIGNASETFNAPDNAVVTSAGGANETTSSAEDAAPDALPAFLSETAA
jgi:ParB family chromosome partitioning protein